jgi:DNA-binding transcriptional ArsR family regulator
MKKAMQLACVSDEGLEHAAECLRTLAHPHRLRFLELLLEGDYTVGELAEACSISSPLASDHLGKMKDRGLLKCERRGRNIFYRVADPHLRNIMDCVRARFE